MWKHGTKADADDREMLYNNSKNFRDELLAIVLKYEKEQLEVDYNLSSWGYKQADQLGYNRALKDIIKLIK